MLRALYSRCMRRPALLTRHFTIAGELAPAKKPRAADTPSLPVGSLCYDHVFKRVMGTQGQSEVILQDLLSAWNMAISGIPGSGSAIAEVKIINTDVKDGAGVHDKGSLTVDVRAENAESNFIVEVQHRTEALFPHRALAYAAADIAGQKAGALKQVHVLAFCDFAFGPPKAGSKQHVGTMLSASRWRHGSKTLYTRDTRLAIHSFGLRPLSYADPALSQQKCDPFLEQEMRARLSFLFALLPHAPLLEEVTAATPPILKWAALIAYLRAENIDAVPRAPKVFTPGVSRLVEVLKESAVATRSEVRAAEELASINAQVNESENDDARAEGRAEGKAEGKAEVRGLRHIPCTAASRPPFFF